MKSIVPRGAEDAEDVEEKKLRAKIVCGLFQRAPVHPRSQDHYRGVSAQKPKRALKSQMFHRLS
jgi:hypothetical protein